jgi:hypothetical protein
VIETMTYDGKNPRNDAHGVAYGEAHTALYALLSETEGCGPAARSARLAQDDELADFLLRVQGEVVEEAGRLGVDGGASKISARARELTVAALLVDEEAAAVGREEREAPKEKIAENLSLEAQG